VDAALVAELRSALHVTNGDSTDVAGTGLAERVVVWRDALHEGPVPAGDADGLRRTRAEFLAAADAGDPSDPADSEEIRRSFEARDRELLDGRHGRYVLWFEADLYCQLQLVEILARLDELHVPAERITLVCIGEHPGIAHFGGLGELTADQLRDLVTTKAAAPLGEAALAIATSAWGAFRSPHPDGVAELTAVRSPDLRFLGEAFERLAREYPSTRDGLSLTERRLLAAAAADPGAAAATLFVRASRREIRPYLGDTWAFAVLERLARGPRPLVTVDAADGRVDGSTAVRPTDDGATVLAGRADHVALNGLDRWIGGVHLMGRDVPWRWDEGSEALVGLDRPANPSGDGRPRR
jgi:hypothetical protein